MMNDDSSPFEQETNQVRREKVPWKLGRQIKPEHAEKLGKLVAMHHQHMLHVLRQTKTPMK